MRGIHDRRVDARATVSRSLHRLTEWRPARSSSTPNSTRSVDARSRRPAPPARNGVRALPSTRALPTRHWPAPPAHSRRGSAPPSLYGRSSTTRVPSAHRDDLALIEECCGLGELRAGSRWNSAPEPRAARDRQPNTMTLMSRDRPANPARSLRPTGTPVGLNPTQIILNEPELPIQPRQQTPSFAVRKGVFRQSALSPCKR